MCLATDRTDKIQLATSLTEVQDVKTAPLEHESVAISKYLEDTSPHFYNRLSIISFITRLPRVT